ncbi:MAG: GNVR domain-containing protein [Candidatus Eisenbacteria bacterium]
MFRQGDYDVREAFRAIARRRAVVIGSTLGFLALALVLNQVTRPAFRTFTRLAIHATPSRSVLTGVTIESPTPSSENLTLLTTAERIMSRDVLEQVALELRAAKLPLRPEPLHLATLLGAGPAKAAGTAAGDAPLREDIEQLLQSVKVKPIRDTRLVDVQAEHHDPSTAAAIANSVAAQFLAREAKHRHHENAARVAALQQQIDEVRGSIEDAEHALYSSRRSTLALSGERTRQLADAAGEVGSDLIKVRSERRVIDAQIARIAEFRNAGTPDWSNPPVQTNALDELYRQLQKTETDAAGMRRLYRDQSPEVVAAEAQVQAVRDAMRRELQKAGSDLEGQREALRAREDGLLQTASTTEYTLKALNDSTYKYSTLEGRLATQREVFALLLKKVQEQEVAQTVEPPAAEVVQAAVLPLEAVRPRKLLNLGVGGVLGLLFGAGLALSLEWVRRTIRTPRDVVHELHLPVIGMIPRRP